MQQQNQYSSVLANQGLVSRKDNNYNITVNLNVDNMAVQKISNMALDGSTLNVYGNTSQQDTDSESSSEEDDGVAVKK